MAILPQPGEVYRHYKGGHYEVVCVALDEETGRRLVVYRGLADGRVWSRSLWSFQQRVTWVDGQKAMHEEDRLALVQGAAAGSG
jgi:hypothetical protein